jgi:DNA-binding beta-propeller fold protein YncE
VAGPLSWVVAAAARRELDSNDAGTTTSTPAAALTAAVTNTAPTAVADGPFTVATGDSITVTYALLVSNDTDPDGDTLVVHSVSTTHGSVVNNTTAKTVTYTPPAAYAGAASFIYRVRDAAGAKSANTATVNLMVKPPNTAPTAVPDTAAASEDVPRTFTAGELVANDTDPDKPYGDTLKINSVGAAVNGTVKLNGDGTVTFTPDANYHGTASFIYRVKDTTGAKSTNTAKVTLTISAVNDAPTAVADLATLTQNTPRTFTAIELVGNDTDPDGDVLKVNSVGAAVHGIAKLNSDGTVTFTPNAGYTGAASFIYRVKDTAGAKSTNTAKVTLMIKPPNTAPVAVNDGPFSTTKGGSITLTYDQLLGNDIDPDKPYGDVLAVNSVSTTKGSIVNNVATRTVTYTPPADFTGATSFIYRVKDSTGTKSLNTANVTVNVKPTPGSILGTVTFPPGEDMAYTQGWVAMKPDGSMAYVNTYNPATGAGVIRIVDTVSNAIVGVIDLMKIPAPYTGLRRPHAPLFSPDGDVIYFVDFQGDRAAFDSLTGELVSPVSDQNSLGVVTGIVDHVITEDGTRIYELQDAVITDTRLLVVDTETNTAVGHYLGNLAAAPTDLAVTRDGSKAYVGAKNQTVVHSVDLAGGTRTTIAVSNPLGMAISPTDPYVYVGAVTTATNTGSLAIIDTRTDEFTTVEFGPGSRRPAAISVSPDGKRIYALNVFTPTQGNLTYGSISVIDAETHEVFTTTLAVGPPLSMAVSPDGSFAYVATTKNLYKVAL